MCIRDSPISLPPSLPPSLPLPLLSSVVTHFVRSGICAALFCEQCSMGEVYPTLPPDRPPYPPTCMPGRVAPYRPPYPPTCMLRSDQRCSPLPVAVPSYAYVGY
eukprot:69593-Rhodomonas_salina.2